MNQSFGRPGLAPSLCSGAAALA